MTGATFSLNTVRPGEQSFAGHARIRGPTGLRLPVLTISFLGIQVLWAVEMAFASPYLLSLGLTKSTMAVVFLAGPISGLVMQPLIGVLADSNTSSWGRRRPYMLFGTLVCILGMLLLGWTRPVAAWFTSNTDSLTIGLAVFSIFLIDFSINAVQAVDRALLVDTIPSSEQPAGNAWAARMLGIGSVAGFFVGNLDLPSILPFFGKHQLPGLSVIASMLFFACHIIVAVLVEERVLLKDRSHATRRGGLLSRSLTDEVKDMFENMWTLPRAIQQICIIQFFSWIAWFPVLFYTTIYVGDIHKRTVYGSSTTIDETTLNAEATRLGSRALFYSALLSLFANLALPFFVAEIENRGPRKLSMFRIPEGLKFHLASLWAAGQAVFSLCMLGTFFTNSVFGATFLVTVTGFSWAITQWVPFSLLAEAILTNTSASNRDDDESILLTDTRSGRPSEHFPGRDHASAEIQTRRGQADPQPDSDTESDSALRDQGDNRQNLLFGLPGAAASRGHLPSRQDDYGPEDRDIDSERAGLVGEDYDSDHEDSNVKGDLSSKAGIILGIHNIFIVIPQFLVTGMSSLIFAIFDPAKSVLHGHQANMLPPPANITTAATSVRSTFQLRDDTTTESLSNSVVYIFRIGGASALVAFVLCYRLSRELRRRNVS